MPTLALMFTMTTYGTWLRGDARGWVDDGIVFPPNPTLEALDRSRLKHKPFFFDRELRHAVGQAMVESLRARLRLDMLAMCVQSWHTHFLVPATQHEVPVIAKCAKDAARWCLRVGRPIWATDYDKRYCFDARAVTNRIDYIERHNLEDNLPRRPWACVVDWVDPSDFM